jgi:hypothetical protein
MGGKSKTKAKRSFGQRAKNKVTGKKSRFRSNSKPKARKSKPRKQRRQSSSKNAANKGKLK